MLACGGTRVALTGCVLALVSLTRSARAEPEVRTRYVGATITAQAGAGVEGFTNATAGGDVFTGVRVLPWFSVEGFFAYHFATRPSGEMGGGAICSGSGLDQWHWQVLGGRAWFHLVRARWVDVSIAPMLAAGVSADRWKSLFGPNDFQGVALCYRPPRTSTGWAVDAGIDFAIEARPAPWLGIRAMFETSLDGAKTSHMDAFGAASVSGWIGPVLRF